MKHNFRSLTKLLLIALVLLAGCKKYDDIIKPGGNSGGQPQPTPGSTKIQITLEALPGETGIVPDLSAVLDIVNQQGQPVFTNKKVALKHDGKYLSDTLTLASGNYTITRLLIVDKENHTRFVIPLTGSPMEGQVQKPLAIAFSLPKPALSQIAVDVLRIAAGNTPEKYGYPAGSFNLPASNDPDETETPDPNPYIKIKVRPLIKIGDIVYDSIPVTLTLTSWSSTGQPKVVNMNLPAGTNEISLPKAAVKYDLLINKWGTVDELSLHKGDVQEGTVYTLGGSKAAKKLKSEYGSKMVKGVWVAETKNVYEYDGSGKLTKVIYYRKRADNTPYVHMTDYFDYNSIGKMNKVVKKDESNNTISETHFSYAQDGKILSMIQKEGDQQTSATVAYTSVHGGTGITGNYNIDIRYQYSHKSITGHYTAQFKGGNKEADDLQFSDGGREQGRYQYNVNINPFVHLNWPDLFLSRTSKHTIGSQQNGYEGNYAKGEYPAATEYVIDADGYPKEAITHYLHPFLGIYLYKTKTVYYY